MKKNPKDLTFSNNKQLVKRIRKAEKSERKRLIDKLDAVFRDYIRYRDNWTCVKCGKCHRVGDPDLNCSHFWSRKNYGTRWDDKNCDALCGKVFKAKGGRTILVSCHGMWEIEKQGEYRDFKLQQLGHAEYQYMEVRARSTAKFSVADLSLMLEDWKKKLAKEIERFKKGG